MRATSPHYGHGPGRNPRNFVNTLDDTFAEDRLCTVLLVVLALAAMLLGGSGLYSSLSYLATVCAVRATSGTNSSCKAWG